MKYQTLADELNRLFEASFKERQKQKEKLKVFQGRIKAEEKTLRKKLKSETTKSERKKVRADLRSVNKAYALFWKVIVRL